MYRDEREVLRDEVFALRREVEQARADQERLVVAEKELAAARLELARVTKPRGQNSGAGIVVVGVAAAVLLIGAGLAVFVLRAGGPRPPSRPTEKPAAVVTATPAKAAPTPIPPPTPVPTPPPPRRAHVQWRATVTKTQGVAVAVGSTCTIDGDVVGDDEGMHVEDVVVRCGTHALYEQRCELEGTSSLDSDAEQHGGTKQGTWSYGLVFSDVGVRGPACNQVMLDSQKKLGKVWSENLPDFRVDLAVAQNSEPTDVAIRVE